MAIYQILEEIKDVRKEGSCATLTATWKITWK